MMRATSANAIWPLFSYTGRIQFSKVKFELLLDIFTLVHRYGFEEVERAMCAYLKVSTRAVQMRTE